MGLGPLRGSFRPPGDKSISHRALLLAGLARGESVLSGLNPGEDCRSSRNVLAALGVRFEDLADGRVRVAGRAGAFGAPVEPLDAGNSGTTMRLFAGVAAALSGVRAFTGDASLRRRPMDRVAAPLTTMGARFTLTDGRFAPFRVEGGRLTPIRYELPVPSAQVKSAVLLAGLLTDGATVVIEPVPTRDHTERMLRAFGVPVRRDGLEIRVEGTGQPTGREFAVPGDISAALFTLVAALLVPGSRVTARGVGVNPTRRAALDILARMGARIEATPSGGGNAAGGGGLAGAEGAVAGGSGAGSAGAGRSSAGLPGAPDLAELEPVADITAGESELTAVEIGGAETAVAIDELPILAVAAACATGTTRIRDAAELRVKESDRIAAMAAGLSTLGVTVRELPDGLEIVGGGPGFRFGGGVIDAHHDHRIAMAFAVAALRGTGEVRIEGMGSAAISDPGFARTLAALRAPGAGADGTE